MNYTIEKSKVTIYKLRQLETGIGWAHITLDEGNKAGRISVASDYGNFSYYWGSCESSFKKFLCQINIHYAADKFKQDGYFDLKKSIDFVKEAILFYRKDRTITKENARKYFNASKELSDCYNQSNFEDKYFFSDLNNFGDGYPRIVTGIDPRFKKFWKHPWQAFIKQLKEEILLNDSL